MNKFTDVMIDLETMGTKSNCLILNIAAVEFNLKTGETGEVFYEKISLADSINNNFKIEADTLSWWLKQDDFARLEILNSNKTCIVILDSFLKWFETRKTFLVWGNSSRFDLGLLENYFNKFNLEIPWKYSNERDVRTLVHFIPDIKKNMLFEGVRHNSIDDCKHQIKYCSKIYNNIKIKKPD